MALIKAISELEEGMVTAEPIINNFSQTLLPAGIELKARHIDMLRMWNIQAVYIKSDDSDSDDSINEEVLKLSREQLSGRLFWEPRNVLEEDLIELGVLAEAYCIIRGNTNVE